MTTTTTILRAKCPLSLRSVLLRPATAPIELFFTLQEEPTTTEATPTANAPLPKVEDFDTVNQYRQAAIQVRRAEVRRRLGLTLDAIRASGLTVNGDFFGSNVLVTGLPEAVLRALALPGVLKAYWNPSAPLQKCSPFVRELQAIHALPHSPLGAVLRTATARTPAALQRVCESVCETLRTTTKERTPKPTTDNEPNGPLIDHVQGQLGKLSAVAKANVLLDQSLQRLGVDSCTVFVREELATERFFLVSNLGVVYEEPLLMWKTLGTTEPWLGGNEEKANDILCLASFGEADALRDGATTTARHDQIQRPEVEDLEIHRLFGTFWEREQVQFSVRLLGRRNGRVVLCFYANFGVVPPMVDGQLDLSVLGELCQLRDALLSLYDEFVAELMPHDYSDRWQRIVEPMRLLNNIVADEQALKDALNRILRAFLEVCRIKPHKGFASFHLHDPKTGLLHWYTQQGELRNADDARTLSSRLAKGVISWPALRHRPLLIHDLRTSPYGRKLHVSVDERARNLIALPLLVGGKLRGVINAEGFDEEVPFSHESVAVFVLAANQAALVLELFEKARLEQELFRLRSERATVLRALQSVVQQVKRAGHNELNPDMDRWANFVGASLEGGVVEFWQCQPIVGQRPSEFVLQGHYCSPNQRPQPAPQQPRSDGFTSLIAREGKPLYITDVQAVDKFNAYTWNELTEEWEPLASELRHEKCNVPTEFGIKSELGIPVYNLKKECVGVAWIKYQLPSKQDVTPTTVLLAELHWAKQKLHDHLAGKTEWKLVPSLAHMTKVYFVQSALPI